MQVIARRATGAAHITNKLALFHGDTVANAIRPSGHMGVNGHQSTAVTNFYTGTVACICMRGHNTARRGIDACSLGRRDIRAPMKTLLSSKGVGAPTHGRVGSIARKRPHEGAACKIHTGVVVLCGPLSVTAFRLFNLLFLFGAGLLVRLLFCLRLAHLCIRLLQSLCIFGLQTLELFLRGIPTSALALAAFQ